ncbi:N-acetylmuramoyl-L-alanine amidase [Solidesulfovibrio fructosivorans]|nr:N-acetylmuramoyl-L-alanine amidase [Solidesulfovibrio fructosivorans]
MTAFFGRLGGILAVVALALLLAAGAVRAAGVAAGYQAAVKEFKALRDDPGSKDRRDLWKALDAKLAALAKAAGKDPLGAKILYYEAWTNAELAERSYLDADWEAAASLYARVAKAYPRHAWSDDALLRRADILAEHLKKPDAAKADLRRILRDHPKGDMADQAKKLLAAAEADAAKDKPEPAKAKAPDKSPTKASASAKAAEARKSSGPPPATSARPAVLRRAVVKTGSAGGRLTLTLDRETTYRYQLLDQKRSDGEQVKLLYIDLDNTRTGSAIPSEKRFAKGVVSRLRAGYFTPDTVRVVLELDGVRQYEIHSEDGPFRIVLDLDGESGGGSKGQFRAEASGKRGGKSAKSADEDAASGKKAQVAKAAPEKADRKPLTPSAAGKKNLGSLVEQLGLSVRTVMIDPGHGGKDPGAQGLYGVTEKDVNLRFAKELGAILRKRGFKVLYTRTRDVFIPLEKRTEMANSQGADLFVSIHCNAHGDPGSSGLETYSLNLANSRDAVRVAARENAASQKKISDLQAILSDLMLSSKTSESKDLAKFVQKRTVSELRGKYRIRDRGPHEAPFFVLIGANMPAVLVELGYITNPTEAKRLSSDAYLRKLADGLADGIVAYKKRIERYAKI